MPTLLLLKANVPKMKLNLNNDPPIAVSKPTSNACKSEAIA